jgi:hypothetical protein
VTRTTKHIPLHVSVLAAAACCLLLCGGQAAGLIRPDFTPVHLVKQSALILELRVESVKDGLATLTVKRALKGKADAPKLGLELKGQALSAQAADFQKKLAAVGQGPVLLAAEGAGGEDKQTKAFLHVEGTWAVFYQAKPGVLRFDAVDTKMLGTWNGGTDMLLRAVDYILADDAADVPVAEGACWSADGARKFGTVGGKVHDAFGIRLSEGAKPALYVASEGGDRLFEYDAAGKDLKDVTAARGLTAKSVAAAWGDFNADGRLDLLSWDGQALWCHTQDAKGAFQAAKVPVAAKVLGLTAVGLGQRCGAIITPFAAGPPLLWTGGEDKPTPLPWDAAAAAGLGTPGPAIVADLDGDGLCDVLLPFAKGSLLYKGLAQGKYAPPRACSAAMGTEPARPLLGDLDGDGLLDIVLPSAKGCGVWHNRGGLQFVETLALCGELAYKAGSDVACGQACDFNRDGRQDLLLLSSAGFPALFFSRGFRCFGYAEGISLEKTAVMPAAQEGQQAGCIADLRADGSQELILVQTNGECWVLPFDTASLPPSVRVAVALRAGPVTVTAWHKARCLGAWNLAGGTDAASIASGHPGPILLKWRSADGAQHEKTVTATNKPAVVVIEP